MPTILDLYVGKSFNSYLGTPDCIIYKIPNSRYQYQYPQPAPRQSLGTACSEGNHAAHATTLALSRTTSLFLSCRRPATQAACGPQNGRRRRIKSSCRQCPASVERPAVAPLPAVMWPPEHDVRDGSALTQGISAASFVPSIATSTGRSARVSRADACSKAVERRRGLLLEATASQATGSRPFQ